MSRVLFTSSDDSAPIEILLGCLVIPRPIAWVVTTSVENVDNVAPYSYFTISALDPPVVQFTSIAMRNSARLMKDSVHNIIQTKEFVICFVDDSLAEKANATATVFPPQISEFDAVGLTRETSTMVRPPRVAESRSAIECRLYDTMRINNDVVVFGEVVCIAVSDDVIRDGFPDPRVLNPASRLGRGHWSTLGSVSARRVAPFVAE